MSRLPRLPAPVLVGSVTHYRKPHTQRRSSARELSGYAGACQLSSSLLSVYHRNSAACTITPTALHTFYLTVSLFRGRAQLCGIMLFTLCSWVLPLDGTDVCAAIPALHQAHGAAAAVLAVDVREYC